jgi:hypothetical protein
MSVHVGQMLDGTNRIIASRALISVLVIVKVFLEAIADYHVLDLLLTNTI